MSAGLMGRSEILVVNCEDVSEDCKAVVVWELLGLLLKTVGRKHLAFKRWSEQFFIDFAFPAKAVDVVLVWSCD